MLDPYGVFAEAYTYEEASNAAMTAYLPQAQHSGPCCTCLQVQGLPFGGRGDPKLFEQPAFNIVQTIISVELHRWCSELLQSATTVTEQSVHSESGRRRNKPLLQGINRKSITASRRSSSSSARTSAGAASSVTAQPDQPK
jgi:hypothetical protein